MFKPIILSFFLLVSIVGSSQNIELGLMVGGSNYSGDFVPELPILEETQLAVAIFGRYNLTDYLSFRGQFSQMSISGSDLHSISNFVKTRNLSFKTPISEFSFIPEFNFTFLKDDEFLSSFRPFIFAGVGYYMFNPTTTYQGQVIELQPLGTEGQGLPGQPEKYQLNQIAIPFGGGLKISIKNNWELAILGNFRYSKNDYLDDTSTSYAPDYDLLVATNGNLAGELSSRRWEYLNAQCDCDDFTPASTYRPGEIRGGSKYRDWFFTFGVSVSYKFLKFSKKGNHRTRCPNWK